MKFHVRFLCTILLALVVFSCSSDEEVSPDITAGVLAARPALPNAAVTEANKDQVLDVVVGNSFSALASMLEGTFKAKPGSFPEWIRLPKTTETEVINETIPGDSAGTLQLNGTVEYTSTTFRMNTTGIFSNFSQDGRVFLAGMTLSEAVGQLNFSSGTLTLDYTTRAAHRFNGDYAGELTYVFTITSNATSFTYEITGEFRSNGQVIAVSDAGNVIDFQFKRF